MYEILLEENDRILKIGLEEDLDVAAQKAAEYVKDRGAGDYELRIERVES